MKRLKTGGYSFTSKEVWNLDYTLRPIIAGGLKRFIADVHKHSNHAGVPGTFCSDFGFDTESEEDYKKALTAWYDALDDMLFAFSVDEPECQTGIKRTKESDNDDGTITYTLEPEDQAAYDRHIEEYKAWADRRQKGAALFGKYFYGLWW